MRLGIFFVLLLAPVRGWTEGQLPAGACAPGSVQSCAPAGVFTTAPAPASREPSFAFSFVPGDSAKIMGANMSCANVTYSTMAPAMAGMPVQELYRCVGANARQNASLLWPKGRLRWEGGAFTAAVQPT